MSEGDREASIRRRPWPDKGCRDVNDMAILINFEELKVVLRQTGNKNLLSVKKKQTIYRPVQIRIKFSTSCILPNSSLRFYIPTSPD